MREIEVLFNLNTDITSAKDKLSSFVYMGAKKTNDIYYYDPLRDNLQIHNGKLFECCRLRNINNKYFVTYKIDIYEGETWQYSNEYETEVSDIDALAGIFINIGLKELVRVNSIKHTFVSNEYKIIIEEVENLGNFLEVEYRLQDDRSAYKIKNDIYLFINTLGIDIGPELNSGKPELLLNKKLKQNINSSPQSINKVRHKI